MVRFFQRWAGLWSPAITVTFLCNFTSNEKTIVKVDLVLGSCG